MSVAEISEFYTRFGTVAFERRPCGRNGGAVRRGRAGDDAQGDVRGRHRPGAEHLQCLLTAVTRNATTDSAWPVSSNPAAKYNDIARPDCNLRIPLWKLVRASTAAPVYFPPEVVSWDANDPAKSFVFVDGGTTAYNNPAFLLFRMATEPAYRLGWSTGEDQLLIVSVGTGSAPVIGNIAQDPSTNVIEAALNTLSALMSQAAVDQDMNCRTIGRCTYGGVIDRELHDLIPRRDGAVIPWLQNLGRGFLYCRYDAELDSLGAGRVCLATLDPKAVCGMDNVAAMPDLTNIGQASARGSIYITSARSSTYHWGWCDDQGLRRQAIRQETGYDQGAKGKDPTVEVDFDDIDRQLIKPALAKNRLEGDQPSDRRGRQYPGRHVPDADHPRPGDRRHLDR